MKKKIVVLSLLTAALSTLAVSPERVIPTRAMRLTPAELDIWNDPDFQKRFAESYIAETDIEPRVTMEERETLEKILDLISEDKMDEAAEQIKKKMTDASSAVFDFTLANIYFRTEKLDQAAEAYETAVDKYPKFLRAWKNLGLVHIRRNELGKAIPALTKTIELGGGDSLTYGLLGFAYSSVENSLPAESAYRLAILLDPETLDWKMGLARSLFRQQRYAEAASLCGHLISQYPDNVDFWLLQANAYIGLEKPMEAAKNYEVIDTMGESTPASLRTLGDIYVNEGLFELAVNSYIQAIDQAPGADSVRVIRAAKVLTVRNALDEARQLIDHIDKVRGERLDASTRKDLLKLRARLAVAEGATGEEVEALREIVKLDPLDGEALILLGQYNRRAGNVEKAEFYFERAANLEQYEADAKLRHAQLLVGERKYAEALPLLRRAQQLKPRADVQEFLEQVERVAKNR
mgnify:CR=1 FL=1